MKCDEKSMSPYNLASDDGSFGIAPVKLLPPSILERRLERIRRWNANRLTNCVLLLNEDGMVP